MADFVAFFPAAECFTVPGSFAELACDLRGPLAAETVESEVVHRAALLRSTESGNRSPLSFHARADGAGWIVIKGIIFDAQTPASSDVPQEMLDQLIAEGPGDLNRYEGNFALAAWDAHNRRGWAFNDQLATMNLYFGEHDGGLYVGTTALPLARALGLALDPASVQEFLARGSLSAPATMFRGLQRSNVGQHARYAEGRLSLCRHWYAYASETSLPHREAVAKVADLATDRVSRYAAGAGTVISDLTGGLDSRFVASALERAGPNFIVTVNGSPALEDVQIAHKVAHATGWPLPYFNTESLWTIPIDPAMRRELTFRTNGELPFTSLYHQLLSRPILAGLGELHVIGIGCDLLRYLAWNHELFTIGRRRPANIERAIRYRFLQIPPPPALFPKDWMPSYRRRLANQIAAICNEFSGTQNTQQLDAVQIWKDTGHGSLYITAAYNWLPTGAPMQAAGFIEAAIALPWQYRVTTQFQRRVIQQLSPRAAAVITNYGSTAEPVRLSNLHLEARHTARRAAHLGRKLEKVLLKGRISRAAASGTRSRSEVYPPFLTDEFRQFLCPDRMRSGALYEPEVLRAMLDGNPATAAPVLLKIATIEQLCHELNVAPDATFLTAGAGF